MTKLEMKRLCYIYGHLEEVEMGLLGMEPNANVTLHLGEAKYKINLLVSLAQGKKLHDDPDEWGVNRVGTNGKRKRMKSNA